MEASGDSQGKVAKRGGLSQRNVGNVVTYGTSHATSPTVRTVDGLAKAFGIAPWLLFVPGIPLELLQSTQLQELIEKYIATAELGRRNIDRVADLEVRYASTEVEHAKQAG